MRSLSKFAYAAVLAVGIFSGQPSLAGAEEAHGTFTLSHEVHWQGVVLRPGAYSFSVNTNGGLEFLTLRGTNGNTMTAMMPVTEFESPRQDAGSDQLVLVLRDGERFVSSMDLPQYDMTLRFAVPRESAAK